MGTLFSLTLTDAVSPIWRLVRSASVETNASEAGVVGEGVGVSSAANTAADGMARASKHRDTIKILTAFDDMLTPHSCYQYSNAMDCADQGWAKVTCSRYFAKQKRHRSYKRFCKV